MKDINIIIKHNILGVFKRQNKTESPIKVIDITSSRDGTLIMNIEIDESMLL